MTPLEKMARAIYEGRNGLGCKAWGSLPAAHRLPYFTDAKQAARAIRVPDEEMEIAGTEQWLCEAAMEDRSGANWTAMIDNILERG